MTLYPPFLKRGITLMPSLILIPQWARHDAAYLAHEQTHAAQQRRIGVLRFWWAYLRSDVHRLAAEVEAYTAQVAAGTSLSYCAHQLSTGYGLNLSYNDAVRLLTHEP